MECFILSDGPGDPQAALDSIAGELDLPRHAASRLEDLRTDKRFLEASHPLVLVPGAAGADLDALVQFARDHSGHAFMVLLADEVPPADYKRLVRTGAADWITWRDCREELRDLVNRLASATVAGRAAKVVSFLPSKGGVGNTTLLVEVATVLASRRKRGGTRVAALDLNLQGGTLADALDAEARFDVAELLGRPERLDAQLIDIFTSRHGRTLDIFASPPNRITVDAISPEIVFTFLDAIAGRYDVVLLDLPAQWMNWTDTLLQGSDAIVLSSRDSVPGLRKAAAILAHIDALAIPSPKLAVAVNAVEADLLGRVSRREVIERPLVNRRTFTIRRDDKTAVGALDLGRALAEVAPGSKAVKDMRRVAEWVEATTDLAQAVRQAPHKAAA